MSSADATPPPINLAHGLSGRDSDAASGAIPYRNRPTESLSDDVNNTSLRGNAFAMIPALDYELRARPFVPGRKVQFNGSASTSQSKGVATISVLDLKGLLKPFTLSSDIDDICICRSYRGLQGPGLPNQCTACPSHLGSLEKVSECARFGGCCPEPRG